MNENWEWYIEVKKRKSKSPIIAGVALSRVNKVQKERIWKSYSSQRQLPAGLCCWQSWSNGPYWAHSPHT